MKIQSLLTLAATSALITSASASITMDWVNVGNPGNAADPATGSLYGAVAYAYQIGKHEVTNSQYGAFLNAKGASNSGAIYNSSMTGTGITQTGSSGGAMVMIPASIWNRRSRAPNSTRSPRSALTGDHPTAVRSPSIMSRAAGPCSRPIAPHCASAIRRNGSMKS